MDARETQIKTETARSDPQSEVTLPAILWLPHGDYALGLRKQPGHDLEWPDFARGLRTLPRDGEGPDYARGLRTLPRDIEGPDYARGLRTLPRTTAEGPDFARGMRRDHMT